MTMTSNSRPAFIGPHERDELRRMLDGTKPLSMFVEPLDREFDYFDEPQFDQYVSTGDFLKRIVIEKVEGPERKEHAVRRVLYALKSEAWRIEAMLMVTELYASLVPGWRPDLERMIGTLLGYDREDIENFIVHMTRSRP